MCCNGRRCIAERFAFAGRSQRLMISCLIFFNLRGCANANFCKNRPNAAVDRTSMASLPPARAGALAVSSAFHLRSPGPLPVRLHPPCQSVPIRKVHMFWADALPFGGGGGGGGCFFFFFFFFDMASVLPAVLGLLLFFFGFFVRFSFVAYWTALGEGNGTAANATGFGLAAGQALYMYNMSCANLNTTHIFHLQIIKSPILRR